MKRLSGKQKLFFLNHKRRSWIRKLNSKSTKKWNRKLQLAIHLNIDIENHPSLTNRSGNRSVQIRIKIPENLSLTDSYDDTMDFFTHLRNVALKRNYRVYLDFKQLHNICPCAALVLAAEIDRWRRVRGFRPRVKQIRQWDQNIARLLNEMGLFDVVEASNRPTRRSDIEPDVIFIPFRSENKTIGEHASKLAEEIEKITRKKLQSRPMLFRGVSEAMTNVANHAYPDDEYYELPTVKGQWWMFASYQKSSQRLTVTFYDQGVGIPRTLPRVHTEEVVMGLLQMLGLIDDDASRIKAATTVGRSQTRQAHRGKGLKDMKRYTHMVHDGVLRILSGRGEYVYHTNGSERCATRQHDIGGTLIQWAATI